jgi:hypothetical protein
MAPEIARVSPRKASRGGAGGELSGDPQDHVACAGCQRRRRQIGTSPRQQQHEHQERVLHEQHVPADGLARVPCCASPEQAGYQASEERGQRQGGGDAADQQQCRNGEHPSVGLSSGTCQEQPCRGGHGQREAAGLREHGASGGGRAGVEPREHQSTGHEWKQDAKLDDSGGR